MGQSTRSSKLPPAIRHLLDEQMASGDFELPVLSATTTKILAICDDEDCDARGLAETLQRDPSLAGQVLRVSNCGAFAPKETIVSLEQAVSRIGFGSISDIAVAASLKGRVFHVPGHQTRIRSMFMHSAAAAVCAREVARLLGIGSEAIFLCGLLHDVGKPLVLQTLLDAVKQRTDKPVPNALLSIAMDEYHEPWGALLVESWALPDWMAEIVGHHHTWREASAERREDAMIVRLGDMLSHWSLDDSLDESGFEAEDEVVAELGLGADDLATLLAHRGDIIAVAEAFL